jgi:hypothetical protein
MKDGKATFGDFLGIMAILLFALFWTFILGVVLSIDAYALACMMIGDGATFPLLDVFASWGLLASVIYGWLFMAWIMRDISISVYDNSLR